METRGLSYNTALILCASFVLFSCQKEEVIQQEVIRAVKADTVKLNGGIEFRTFNGTTQSGSETNLSFRTSGQVEKIFVKVGQTIKQGELIAQLDTRDLSLSYEQAKASAHSAKMGLQTAASTLERTKALYQGNSASLSDYESAKNAHVAASAQYQNARKALSLQASQFDYAKIVSPTKGVVSRVNIEVGEVAQPGNPAIVLNSDSSDIEVNVGVPENYIAKVQSGATVKVKVSDRQYEGRITEVGFTSSSALSYPVIVKVIEPDVSVRPGMPAEVEFRFGSETDAKVLTVPVAAVGADSSGNFVYRLKDAQNKSFKVEKVKLTVGVLNRHGFTVLSGVDAGDVVATAGLRTLFDGQIVRILSKNELKE